MSVEIGKTIQADVNLGEQEGDNLLATEDEDLMSWSQNMMLFVGEILPALSMMLMRSNTLVVNTFAYRMMDRIGTIQDINGLGLWANIISNFSCPFYMGVQEKTNFSSAFYMGQGSNHLVRKCLLHGLAVMVLNFTIVYLVLIVNIKWIAGALGSEPEVEIFAEKYFPLLFLMDMIGQIRQLIVLYSVCQVNSNGYGLISIVSMVTTIPLMAYFESLNLGVMSYIYAKLYNEVFLFLFAFVYGYRNNKVGPISLEDIKSIPSGFMSFFLDSMGFCAALGLERLGYSMSVIMCFNIKDKVQTAAYNIFFHFTNFTISFGAGFGVTSRTEINKLIGMKQIKKARNLFHTNLVGLTIVSYILSASIYFARSLIADFYTKSHPDLTSTLIQLISIYCILFICSSTFYNFGVSITRMMNQLTLLMALQLIIMIILQFGLQYAIVHMLNKYYDIGAAHIMISYHVLHLILLGILLTRLHIIPWDM